MLKCLTGMLKYVFSNNGNFRKKLPKPFWMRTIVIHFLTKLTRETRPVYFSPVRGVHDIWVFIEDIPLGIFPPEIFEFAQINVHYFFLSLSPYGAVTFILVTILTITSTNTVNCGFVWIFFIFEIFASFAGKLSVILSRHPCYIKHIIFYCLSGQLPCLVFLPQLRRSLQTPKLNTSNLPLLY